MLTPIEIQSKTFKTGFGFDKKDVESFIKDIVKDYEVLYKENMELNEKIGVLSEGVQYYKSIEKTLQKALVLAQKAAQETETAAKEKADNIVNTATNKAAIIEEDAHQKAKEIKTAASDQANTLLSKARQELEHIQADVANLLQQYDKYKIQYKQLINTQLEILDSPAYNVDYSKFMTYHSFISTKLSMPEFDAEEEVEESEAEELVEAEETVAETEEAEETVAEEAEAVSDEAESEDSAQDKNVVIEEEEFIPTIDLSGILDDVDTSKEEASHKEDELPIDNDPMVTDHGMKEILSKSKEGSAEPGSSELDRTLNEMSEKELLLKLFSNASDSQLKANSTDTKSDFKFLDL